MEVVTPNGTLSPNVTDAMNGISICDPSTNYFSAENSSALTALQRFGTAYAGLHGYVSICVCLFGFMANMANIIVLTRKNMVSSTNFILTWLAIADLFTMLDYFPFAMHFYILKDVDLHPLDTRGYGWICFLLFHGSFSIICHTIAIWLTIALAIFRFLYIWFPTKGSTLCTLDHAKKVIVVIIFSTIFMCIPNVIANDFGSKELCVYSMNETSNSSVISGVDKIYHWKPRLGGAFDFNESLNFFVQASLMKIIPCIMLTLLTILLIVAMHRAYKRRMALKNKGKKEDADKHNEHNRTTLMLLAVVVLFLLTELPQGIMTILNSVDDEFYASTYMPLGDLFDITALCNNAINFVLYCTMSTQFRQTFHDIFCRCCPKVRPGWRKMGVAHAERNGTKVTTTHV